MKTIGLTGGIATGKSSAAQILKKYGLKVINADELAHKAIEPGKPGFFEVLREFGAGLLTKEGRIDRAKLGEIVFQNCQARERLEGIIHPQVIQEIKNEIQLNEKEGLDLLIVEVPLLFEVGVEDLFTQIWVISTSSEEQLRRLQKRDQLNDEQARLRIISQLPLANKEGKADVVIYNNKGLSDLEEQLKQLLEKTVE